MSLWQPRLPPHDAGAQALTQLPAEPRTMPNTRWGAEALWQQLVPLLPGLSIEVVARADSTNTQLRERSRLQSRRRASEPAFGRRVDDTSPSLLIAEHQTSGRGRLGRTWRSSAGASLTFSLALPLLRRDWSGLSLAVGVAVAEALDPRPPGQAARLWLKWPNDLMLVPDDKVTDSRGRKLGGILIESVAIGEQRMAIVGIGLNVRALDLGTFSDGIASLQELNPGIDAPRALSRLALRLVQALLEFEQVGFCAFAERFAARDLLRGRLVTTTLPGVEEGIADGVDATSGALRVSSRGEEHLVSGGEVSVRLVGDGHTMPDNSG